jgi:hypothetical protein
LQEPGVPNKVGQKVWNSDAAKEKIRDEKSVTWAIVIEQNYPVVLRRQALYAQGVLLRNHVPSALY